MRRLLFLSYFQFLFAPLWGAFLLLMACSESPAQHKNTPKLRGIVSLDYCADQYVLALADPADILALSPQATAQFSYLRAQARQFRTLRPRAEDILTLQPALVVRSYGGGPMISTLLERAGIHTVQLPFSNDLAEVEKAILDISQQLGKETAGATLVAQMHARLAALPASKHKLEILYLTSKGVTAGPGTMIDVLIKAAGLKNFNQQPGWQSIPLEALAYQAPAYIATGFFDSSDLVSNIWTSARHPVAQRALAGAKRVDLPGAWTACGGWFMLDAVEAMAAMAHQKNDNAVKSP